MPFDINTAKKLFFDRPAVRDALTKGTRRALSKFGAFVRTRSRRSIRKRKAISQPGSPPSSHEGSLRKLIFFAFDANRRSVVIGPVPFKKGTVPQLLEEGGTVTRTERDGRTRVLVYRPRPYMAPAFNAELPRAPQMFKDAVRR